MSLVFNEDSINSGQTKHWIGKIVNFDYSPIEFDADMLNNEPDSTNKTPIEPESANGHVAKFQSAQKLTKTGQDTNTLATYSQGRGWFNTNIRWLQ